MNITPLKMDDTTAFRAGKRVNSFDNSVSSVEGGTEDTTTPIGSINPGVLGQSNLNISNNNIANGVPTSLPVMTPDKTVDTPAKTKRSRNDVTLNASVQYDHNSKRGGMSSMMDSSTKSGIDIASHTAPAESFSHSNQPNVGPATTPKRKKKSILEAYPMHKNASDASRDIIVQLKSLYKNRIKPIEQKFNLYNFCLPTNAEIHDSEFDAKPMVLLIGQYSTGKTTFIRHLVGGDYPSMHIGPEPTTDRFTALIHGNEEEAMGGNYADEHELEDEFSEEEDDNDTDNYNSFNGIDDEISFMNTSNITFQTNPKNVLTKRWKKDGVNKSSGKTVKGNSLTVMPELPFSSLATFGSGFLSHFVGSVSPAPLLEHVTLIDTPGVLSGEKQRLSRSYDFAKASRWFADRSDLILLLFDAHKLDISDELKEVIETIRPHNDDKIRCILNKADGVTREQLVRVYGSLMWSMGKIFNSPEVVRVFTGSYWDEPLVHDDFENMFESDEWLLIHELVNLPKSCAERKVNEVVKRIRIIKVHVCIMTYLKSQMPRWFGKKKVQESLIVNLDAIFDIVRIDYNLSSGDFPDIQEFAACLREVEDFSGFMTADKKTLRLLDELILIHIPNIMKGTAGITDPFSPKSKNRNLKRTPLKGKRKLRTPKKIQRPVGNVRGVEDSIDDETDVQSKVDTRLMKKPVYVEEKSKTFSFMGMFIFTFLLGYISLFVLIQQDVHNAIGFPPFLLDHSMKVSSVFDTMKQFLEDHIYDSRDFNVV